MEESSKEISNNGVAEDEVSAVSFSIGWKWESKLSKSSGFLGGSIIVLLVVVVLKDLNISHDG